MLKDIDTLAILSEGADSSRSPAGKKRGGRSSLPGYGNTPCAQLSWDVIPSIRKGLAEELLACGLNQRQVAERLGVSRGAISQYQSKRRGNLISFDEPIQKEIKRLAHSIYEGRNAALEICRLCKLMRKNVGID